MIHFRGETAGHIYRQQLDALLRAPEVMVRGLRTKELLNVVTEITEPRRRLQIVPGRRLNPWLAMAESLWLLAGRNDLASLLPYNSRMESYSDDGETLYGAYGYRLTGQIEPLLERLGRDHNDRRAVLSIWKPEDLMAETADPPCNDMLMFKIRQGRLHMSVFCRSNDLHWGLQAVNLPQFSILQEYLATRLRVEVGEQLHFSQSLHIYLDGPAKDLTYDMVLAAAEPFKPLPADDLLFPTLRIDVAKQSGYALDGELAPDPIWSFGEFAFDFLEVYRKKSWKDLNNCRNAYRFPSWIALAEEWLRCLPPLSSKALEETFESLG